MSNAGQVILTIAGFAIGVWIGYPQLGLVLGSLAGQALFPTQLPEVFGPKLTDTRTTNSDIGGPVMEVFGTDVVPGTVIWLSPIRTETTTEEQGGKGGGAEQTVTTYNYFQSIAIGLCRADRRITGVARIWENGELVYDGRPQQEGEEDTAYEQRVALALEYAETFVLYLGGPEQDPDPTIQQYEGEDNVPGFSGLAYIVYPERQLQDDQGRRHPNFRFEIAASELVYTFTTPPYPIYELNAVYSVGSLLKDAPSASMPIDAIYTDGVLVSGTLRENLVTYTNYPPEAVYSEGSFQSGTLRDVVLDYSMQVEAVYSTGALQSGVLDPALITYSIQTEAVYSTGSIVSGALT